ncbi:protein FAM161A isoform X2 [Nannospalax galili]|uniref:protein FAM161A isoform X2 n=1 Tax=Nannospalax galili TaxID=1026970 RepID=UPI0004ED66BD|nr:protein FAM161A isoform X2 [Nannospalax galili]
MQRISASDSVLQHLLGTDYNASFSGKDGRVTCKNAMNFSDVHHSNEEYFRKLKELKAAHIEAMAKLEKMCRDKLNLKEAESVVTREDSSSISSGSTSEKNPYQPVLLVTSVSEPHLGRSSSLLTSEEDLPSLEKERPGRDGMMSYARELISNMWTNFCVEDYIQPEDPDFHTVENTGKKPKKWTPTVTIPVPFQMMVREQKKKEAATRARSEMEVVQRLLRKEEDDLECKKFRANPVPTHIFLPLYQDMLKKDEERRRATKEKNREILLASQRPFSFIEREEQKQAAREKQLRDFFKAKKKTKRFRARPLPQSIYGSPTRDKLEEEELYRNIRMPLKAQELLHNLSLPCRPAHRHFRKPRGPGQTAKLRCKHKCRCQSSGDEDLPEKWKEPFSEHSFLKHSTVYKPFCLHESSSESAKRQKILADIRADEENLKETRWPYLSPRRKSPVGSACAKPRPCHYVPPMPTACSRGRERAIRRTLEEKKMLEEERTRILTKQKQRMKELQKVLTTRVKAYDSHQSLAQMCKSKVKYLRKCEKARMREYQQELEDRDEKLRKRPLLFERVAQKNARMAAEKHYSNTLKALGISDEFVSKKGQSGKVFEYISKQMKSCTADKESFNEEEKIEERENEEENYFIDTSSQDSCKEKDEDVEESGEENSVEE